MPRDVVVGVVASMLWLQGLPAARAQFPDRPFSGMRVVPLPIDSRTEHLLSGVDVAGAAFDYAPNLDMRRRIVANAWARSATIRGAADSTRRLSADTCVESRDDRSPSIPCTTMLGAVRDRLEAYWGWDLITAESTVFGATFNRTDGVRLPLSVPGTGGGDSLHFPGLFFRFISNAPPAYNVVSRWTGLPGGSPRGEDTGFRVADIILASSSPAARGYTNPLTIVPYERVTGILLEGPDAFAPDSVAFWLDPAFPRQTLAVWLDPTSGNVTVYGRCGALPTPSAFHISRSVNPSTPGVLDTTTWGVCGSFWGVVVANFTTARSVFQMRVGAHHASREASGITVGIETPTSGPAEDAFIRAATRQAAWRFYGATGGTQLLRSFTYWAPGASCEGSTLCWRNRPNGGWVPVWECTNHGRAIAHPINGTIMICHNPLIGSIDEAAQDLSHEWAHVRVGTTLFNYQDDEYFISGPLSQICGDDNVFTWGCSHSLMGNNPDWMNSFCTTSNHGSTGHVLSEALAYIRIGVTRTETRSECDPSTVTVTTAHAGSPWATMWGVGTAPAPHGNWSADNHNFRNFALGTSTFVGRNLN